MIGENDKLYQFFKHMAICHSVRVDNKEEDDEDDEEQKDVNKSKDVKVKKGTAYQ
jgi:hypothetical protein